MPRRAVIALLSVVVVGLVVLGLTQTGTDNEAPESGRSLAEQQEALAGAPAPIAALAAEAGELEGGGKAAIERRLKALEGTPVVVNKWASWCGPCRYEFPFFQEAVTKYGKRVAFVGLNAGDNDGNARKFLAKFPVAFPHVTDPDEKAARALGAGTAYPVTLFYGPDGEQAFVHQGSYATAAKLDADIERYALGGG